MYPIKRDRNEVFLNIQTLPLNKQLTLIIYMIYNIFFSFPLFSSLYEASDFSRPGLIIQFSGIIYRHLPLLSTRVSLC